MRKFLLIACAGVLALGLSGQDAEAKRLGYGASDPAHLDGCHGWLVAGIGFPLLHSFPPLLSSPSSLPPPSSLLSPSSGN